jgi:hypothetical protein
MKRKLFLMVMYTLSNIGLASFGQAIGSTDVEEQAYYQNEINNVMKFKEGQKNNIFFIYIFDHLFPIPDRFVLLTKSKHAHEFSSMAGTKFSGPMVIGSISVGLHKIHEKTTFDIDLTKYDLIDEGGMVKNVSIYKRKKSFYKNNNIEEDFSQYIFSDGKEYLILTDGNAELWRAMLEAAKQY